MKKCSWCGKEYPEEVLVCAVDQQALVSDALQPPVATGASPPKLRSCIPWIIFWHVFVFFYLVSAEEGVIWLASMLAYWSAVGVGLKRRKGQLTRWTALIVSHGLIVISIFAVFMFYFIARLRGLL